MATVTWIERERYTPDGAHCRIEDWSSVAELIELRAALRTEIPQAQPLFILDDAGQAEYTSGHRTSSDVWLVGEEDRREFSAMMTRWLSRQLVDCSLQFEEQLRPIGGPSVDSMDLLGHLEAPERLFVDPLNCWIVESPDPSMAIASKPNGYFGGDLTPAQNYLLAEQLRETFGLEIFGLGASFAAYCRSELIGLGEATEMVERVRGLYSEMTDALAQQWAERTAGGRWFALSYCGA